MGFLSLHELWAGTNAAAPLGPLGRSPLCLAPPLCPPSSSLAQRQRRPTGEHMQSVGAPMLPRFFRGWVPHAHTYRSSTSLASYEARYLPAVAVAVVDRVGVGVDINVACGGGHAGELRTTRLVVRARVVGAGGMGTQSCCVSRATAATKRDPASTPVMDDPWRFTVGCLLTCGPWGAWGPLWTVRRGHAGMGRGVRKPRARCCPRCRRCTREPRPLAFVAGEALVRAAAPLSTTCVSAHQARPRPSRIAPVLSPLAGFCSKDTAVARGKADKT